MAIKNNREIKSDFQAVLDAAAHLPKGPALQIGKRITGGRLTLRYLVMMNAEQEKALTAVLERHSAQILEESGKILGIEVRAL